MLVLHVPLIVIQKNKEACLKVLDYLSDDTSKDGWFANTNDTMGEAVPCMPYEGQYSAKYMDDYKAYMDNGTNRPWVYQQLPAGSNTEIGNIYSGIYWRDL